MPNLIDLTGKRLGTFTVRGRAPDAGASPSAWWLAVCDCGAEVPVRGDRLRAGSVCPKCTSARAGRRIRNFGGLTLSEFVAANSEYVTECGCLLWTGAADQNGYGVITVNRKPVGAHRVSWSLANGPIPGGLHILHRCDTPPCINPDHLFLGTPADNVADMIRKQRHRFGRRHLYR